MVRFVLMFEVVSDGVICVGFDAVSDGGICVCI